jgi:superfamily II DNA or RNA helicase
MNRPKSPDELSDQLSQTEEVLGTEFFKDPKRREEALRADQRELQLKYPYRWDQYQKIVKGEAQTTEFTSARNYIRLINNLEGYIASYEQGRPEGFLREHQQDTFHKLAEFFNAGHKSGYLDLPTGSGKTVTFVELVKALAGNRNGRTPLKTLVLVPSKDLVVQTMGRDGKKGFGKFAPSIKVTSYYQEEKDLSGEVVVSTYDSFINLMRGGKIPPSFADLIICDEAHEALGKATSKEIEGISANAIKIALTATAEYSVGKKVSNLFPELIHKIELQEAIEAGILSNARGFLYRTHVRVENMPPIPGRSDYPRELLMQLDKEARNAKAIEFAAAFAEGGHQGIISCLPGNKLEHAFKIERMCNEREITDPRTGSRRKLIVRTIEGEMPMKQRDDLYNLFDNGQIDALTFVGTLEKGWDHERAKFLINLRPTRSRVFASQRLGRVMRLNELDQDALVVEFEDEFGEKNPYTIFDIFEKRRIRQGSRIVEREKEIESRGATGSETVELPEELLKNLQVEAEITREFSATEKAPVDFSSKEDLSAILADSPIGLTWCGLEDFRQTIFGKDTEFGPITGGRLLRNFGSAILNVDNLRNLLHFIGLENDALKESEGFKLNKNNLREVLNQPDRPIDLIGCSVNDFKHVIFGAGEQNRGITGKQVLRRLGDHKETLDNLIQILKLVGIEKSPPPPPKGKEKKEQQPHREVFPLPDFDSRDDMGVILVDSPVDLANCGLDEFRHAVFGTNTKFGRVTGFRLLRNFGSKKENLENLRNLLEFVGLNYNREVTTSGYKRREFRREGTPVNLDNPEELREFLLHPHQDINIAQCTLKQFRDTRLGKETGFRPDRGNYILEHFGSLKHDNENFLRLLEFAGIKREPVEIEKETEDVAPPEGEVSPSLDFSSKDDLGIVLADSPINLMSCGVDEFRHATFGKGTKFGPVTGFGLLKRFGSGKENRENLRSLLNFVGIETLDINNLTQLKDILSVPNLPIDLEICGVADFQKATFGANLQISGSDILHKWGNRKEVLGNLINLLTAVGVENKRIQLADSVVNPRAKKEGIDYDNPEQLHAILSNPIDAIDIAQVGVNKFRTSRFRNGEMGSVNGETLLLNFGSKEHSAVNFAELLRFAGIQRSADILVGSLRGLRKKGEKVSTDTEKRIRNNPDFFELNEYNLADTLSRPDKPINLETCTMVEFRDTTFGIVEGSKGIKGKSILRRLGSGNESNDNLREILKSIGINRK